MIPTSEELSFLLERMIAVADCKSGETTAARQQRLNDLQIMLGQFRIGVDRILSHQEKNAHPVARSMARLMDHIHPLINQTQTPVSIDAILQETSIILSRLEDDWQSIVDFL
jgi:hypothetical protein